MTIQPPIALATPEYTEPWARVVDVIRWLLVVVLVLDVVAGVLTQPRQSLLTDLRQDLTSGKVRSVTFADRDQVRFFILTSARFLESDQDRPVVLWRTGPVDYRVADLRFGAPFLPNGGSQQSASRLRSQISRVAAAQGVPRHSAPRDLLLRYPQVGVAAFLLLLAVLVCGGQPRRASRWATFWLLLTPMNIGVLRSLAMEAPWSAAMRAWPAPPPHRMMPLDARMSGGPAFLLLLLSSLAVALGLSALAALRW